MLNSYAAPVILISTVRYRALARTRVLSTGVYSLAPQAYLTRALAIKMTIRNSPTNLVHVPRPGTVGGMVGSATVSPA